MRPLAYSRMTEILLARHAETDWNREGRVQGHTDRPLNELGVEQASDLAEALKDVELDAIYASDLARARDTARVVADLRGLRVTQLPELRERDFGSWEGLTRDEVLSRFPDASNGPWGDAETLDEMTARVLAALELIATRHPEGRVLVVTHGGPLRAVLREGTIDGDLPIVNCHVARIGVMGADLRSLD